MPTSLAQALPIEFQPQPSGADAEGGGVATAPAEGSNALGVSDSDLKSYIVTWRNSLRAARLDKQNIWNECWQLYRGLEDWTDKEDWQTKIMLPKAWSSVKQASSLILRLLMAARKPWSFEAVDPDDILTQLRAEQRTELTSIMLENASFFDEFGEGLECGFIMGLGVWKLWWGLKPKQIIKVVQRPGLDGSMSRQLIKQDTLEGRLFIRAVDPYNFYWLPGSKLNRWAGTIEDIEVPKWELMLMAQRGMLDPERVARLQGQKIDESQRQSALRFSEKPTTTQPGPNKDTALVKLTEYYGPIVLDSRIVEANAHVLLANDTEVLVAQQNPFYHAKAPYVGFSPLSLPFRTEGVGLVEMVRAVLKALSRLANLSVDTLLFRLLPVFEVTPDVYENPEDFETGLTPGKIFRRNIAHAGQPGLQPIEFQDISQGAVAVSAQLDRAHQEGSLISEIQQGLPRYRGAQTATETEIKQDNQDTFFGNMAVAIEKQAIEPIVDMAGDLIFQFIDTASDPRIASVLGVNGQLLSGMSREELMEMIQGDFKIKVTGISGQLAKAEMLQNLVQLMNLIGQNPEAWLPYINQDKLLQRILEAFRPAIHDIEDIVADPETAAAKQQALGQQRVTPELIALIPQLVQMATAAKQQGAQTELEQQRMAHEASMQGVELDMRRQELAAAAAKQGASNA